LQDWTENGDVLQNIGSSLFSIIILRLVRSFNELSQSHSVVKKRIMFVNWEMWFMLAEDSIVKFIRAAFVRMQKYSVLLLERSRMIHW